SLLPLVAGRGPVGGRPKGPGGGAGDRRIGERESLSRKPEACVICRRRVVHDPCDPPPIEVRLTMAHHVRRRTAAALAVICATSLAAAPAAAADGPDAAALMAAVEDHCGEN